MDPRLLEYYNRELSYLRETGAEFATLHPKIAARLGMQGTDIADPYVERMIEAFSFLSARTQLKIDAEFPASHSGYWKSSAPITSPHAIDGSGKAVSRYAGRRLRKGSPCRAIPRSFPIPKVKIPPASFAAADVTLWPLSIEEVRLTAAPPDMPALHRYLPPNIHVAGALRITLRTFGELTFSELAGPARLPFYLCGEERIASHLFELLHTSAVATLAGEPGHFDGELNVNLQHPVAHEGLEPGRAAAARPNVFHGHNLLHEFFACPNGFTSSPRPDCLPGYKGAGQCGGNCHTA